jgi:hypothetical protein
VVLAAGGHNAHGLTRLIGLQEKGRARVDPHVRSAACEQLSLKGLSIEKLA